MRLTFVHPCIGRKPGASYLKTWKMEPLTLAVLAARTPPDVEIRFYDDRLEPVPFDETTDLVAISVETYTARRAYQIATEYRRRSVPVVMGGFHATLATDEVLRHAECVVVGEAEALWPEVLDDFRAGSLRKLYRCESPPVLAGVRARRSLYTDRRYLPIGLVEAGRGCPFGCDFCAIHGFYKRTYRRRPVADILAELGELKSTARLVFFVDDNIAANRGEALELMTAMAPLGIRWVSQASLNLAEDEELMFAMRRAGCEGLLLGFESMDESNLRVMDKSINLGAQGYGAAMNALRRHGLRVYGTFVFGYDHDTPQTFAAALEFALTHGLFLCGFSHLLPLPGTPLYDRLQGQGRLINDPWWLDQDYRFNQLAFRPASMSPAEVREQCLWARRRFYGLTSTLRRARYPSNRQDWTFLKAFFSLNILHRFEVGRRDDLPLGDPSFEGPILEAER